MSTGSLWADEERSRYLFVGPPGGHQPQDLRLAFGEAIVSNARQPCSVGGAKAVQKRFDFPQDSVLIAGPHEVVDSWQLDVARSDDPLGELSGLAYGYDEVSAAVQNEGRDVDVRQGCLPVDLIAELHR